MGKGTRERQHLDTWTIFQNFIEPLQMRKFYCQQSYQVNERNARLRLDIL
jgi:hypothetical protein